MNIIQKTLDTKQTSNLRQNRKDPARKKKKKKEVIRVKSI